MPAINFKQNYLHAFLKTCFHQKFKIYVRKYWSVSLLFWKKIARLIENVKKKPNMCWMNHRKHLPNRVSCPFLPFLSNIAIMAHKKWRYLTEIVINEQNLAFLCSLYLRKNFLFTGLNRPAGTSSCNSQCSAILLSALI